MFGLVLHSGASNTPFTERIAATIGAVFFIFRLHALARSRVALRHTRPERGKRKGVTLYTCLNRPTVPIFKRGKQPKLNETTEQVAAMQQQAIFTPDTFTAPAFITHGEVFIDPNDPNYWSRHARVEIPTGTPNKPLHLSLVQICGDYEVSIDFDNDEYTPEELTHISRHLYAVSLVCQTIPQIPPKNFPQP